LARTEHGQFLFSRSAKLTNEHNILDHIVARCRISNVVTGMGLSRGTLNLLKVLFVWHDLPKQIQMTGELEHGQVGQHCLIYCSPP
jgi:hypothetical protein